MKEIIKLSPFKKMCMTIGNLPSSFLESMTYWEGLNFLVDYLEKTVIPAVNNNGEAITELQTAFTTLKNYVDNYFENLDVQEEINNKLDEMAESGQLTDIIAGYIQLKGILAYDNIADMKNAENLVNGSFAETYGFYNKGDGGSAKYKIREIINTDNVNEINIFALNDENLIAELIPNEKINLKQLGAKGNSFDNSDILQFAIDNYNNIAITNDEYLLNDTINLKSDVNIELDNATIISNAGYCFRIESKNNIIIKGGLFKGDNSNDNQTIFAITDSSNCLLKDIEIQNCLNKGIAIGGNSNNNNIDNIIVTGATSSTGAGISLSGENVKYNNLSNIIANENRIGITLNGCYYNKLNNITCNENNLIGFTIDGIVTGEHDGGQYNVIDNIICNDTTAQSNYGGIYIGNGSSNNSFNNVVCTGDNVAGIRVVGGGFIDNLSFNNVNCQNNGTGISITGSTNIVVNNGTVSNNTGRGLVLISCDSALINNLSIKDNGTEGLFIQSGKGSFSNLDISGNNEGLEIAWGGSTPHYNKISNCNISDNTSSQLIKVGTQYINNCSGYINHNYGSASVTSPYNISHGLSETPKSINITPSVADRIVSITNITSSAFTISLTDLSGTPITQAETIYWDARC